MGGSGSVDGPRIGCLGWGSLLWDPRGLPMSGPFREPGPALPIEFSRVATDGRATLVIDPEAAAMPTAWAPLRADSLEAAVSALGHRERVRPERWPDWIGGEMATGARSGAASTETRESIRSWLEASGLDGVVWTALPMRDPAGRFERPTADRLVDHLRRLEGAAFARAEEYVRRAPAFVRTANRARFERELGWTPTTEPANLPTPGAREEPVT